MVGVATSAYATPVLYYFSGTVADSGGTSFAVGSHITGTFVVDDKTLGSNGNASFYPLISASVALPQGAGILTWDGQAGSASVANDLQGLDQFDLNASLGGGNGVFIQTQDDQGTIFADEELPKTSVPLSEFEVARLEVSFQNDGPWGTCSFPQNCQITASVDVFTPNSIQAVQTEAITRAVSGIADFLYTQQNDALQVIVSSDDFSYEARRGFLEFNVPDFPDPLTATLVLQKYDDADSGTNPILVSVYEPSAAITLDTYNSPATPFANLPTNPASGVESVRLDISPLISEHRGTRLGLRLSVSDEGTAGANIFGGAAFDDGYLGTPPKVEIVPKLPGSTSTGTDVPVEIAATLPDGSSAPVTMSFDNVTSAGETSVDASTEGPLPPTGFKLGNPPVYYDITTTAVFSGNVELCFTWLEGQFSDEDAIRLWHNENSVWVDITTSLDTEANKVCGSTSSFSPFVITEVSYNFNGFFPPVDNPPVLNSLKGGQAVPVKFSLGGDYGLDIFANGSPGSQTMSCSDGGSVDTITETVTAGTSSLQYDSSKDQYTYVWKTQSKWANSCRKLILKLKDGSQYTADFQFKK